MIFTTIASSSDGNCTYVSTGNTNVLIDAGLSGKKIVNALSDINVSPENIDAIFVTHEHIDHVRGVGVLSRKYDIPVYATQKTWDCMPTSINKEKIDKKNINYIYKDENFIFNDILIHPFEIPHDVADPVGFTLKSGNSKMAVATDMGHITKKIINNLYDCNALVLESNHDVEMLKSGPYELNLKKRILGKEGHISNEIAGKLLACIMNENLKICTLAHLSEINNTEELAFETVKDILEENGIKVGKYIDLSVASRYGVERINEI